MDVKAEQKFMLLKKRLDSLHYCQPLTVESAALVERLLNDLIKTTEGYQNIKKSNEENLSKLQKSDNFLAPLKADNHKLIKENNDLHVAMMKLKEETEFKENKWKTQQRSLEGEKKDFKFVLEQKDLKHKKLVDENVALKSKLDLVLSKVYNPYNQNGLENMPAEYRNENDWSQANISLAKKTDFQLSRPLGLEEEVNKFSQQKQSDYKQWQDALRYSQERGEQLLKQIDELEDSKKLLEEKQRNHEIQLKNRDNEILRIQGRVDMGSVNLEKLSSDYNLNQQVDKNERLYHQIDFLTGENSRLEKELKDLNSQMHRTKDMRSENVKLNRQVDEYCEKLEQSKQQLLQFEQNKANLKQTLQKDFLQAQEQTNKKVAELQSLIDDKETEISDLQAQLQDLFRDNEDLKTQLDKSDQVVQSYKSDKRAFSQNLQTLQQEQNFSKQQVNEIQQQIQEKQALICDLQEEVNIQISKNQTLQRTIDLNDRNNERIQNEYKFVQEELKKQKSQISHFEQQNLDDQQQKNELQMELQRVINSKKNLEEQLDKFRNETYKIKSETEGKSVASERLAMLLEDSQKDGQYLRKELRTLEDLQRDLRGNLQDEEHKNKELFYKLKVLQESLSEVEKQYKITTELLQEKINALRQSENQRTEIERENMELRSIKKSLHETQTKLQKQNDSSNSNDIMRLKYTQELDLQRFKIIEQEQLIISLERQLENETKERKKLADQLDQTSLANENLSHNLNRNKEKEREIDTLRNDLERTKEREKKLIISLEKHVQELQKSEQMIANGARNAENANYQKEELLREIQELNQKLLYMGSDKQDGYTRSIQLQEKVNAQEIAICDLKDNLKKEEKKNQNLFEEVTLLNDEVSKLRSDKLEKEAYIKQLKTLAEGLERIKEELLQRLQSKSNENYDTESEKNHLRKEIKDQKLLQAQLEEELKETRTSLINIDRERDEMQEQLDIKCEENQKLKLGLQNAEIEIQQLKDRIYGFSSKCDSGNQRLNELEQQIKERDKKLQNLLKENENCKYTLQIKDKEHQELANDLNIVTRENQSLSGKLVKTSQQRDELREQLNSFQLEDKKHKQDFRGAELEKQDILNNYKQVCTVNERMERVLQEQANENQQLFMRVKECEKEIATMTAHFQHFENREQQMLQEIQAQERQINFQNQKLEQQNQDFAQIQQQKANTYKEFQYMRQVTEGVESSREDIQRNLLHLQNENILLNDTIVDMKRKMDVLKSQHDYEKGQSQQLEQIILKERANQHRLEQEQANFAYERAELRKEIDRLSQKKSIGGDLEAEKLREKLFGKNEEGQKMMLELRQLREENSKLQLRLYKYESERQEMERRSSGSEAMSSLSEQYENKELEKFKQEVIKFPLTKQREIYKKSLNETQKNSKMLSQKVKYLEEQLK